MKTALFLLILLSLSVRAQTLAPFTSSMSAVPLVAPLIRDITRGTSGYLCCINYAGQAYITYNSSTRQYSFGRTPSTPGSATVAMFGTSLAASAGDTVVISGVESPNSCVNGTYKLTAADNSVHNKPMRGYAYTFRIPSSCRVEWLEQYDSTPAMAVDSNGLMHLFYHDHCCFNTQELALDGRVLERTSMNGVWGLPTVAVSNPLVACPRGHWCSPNNIEAVGLKEGDVEVVYSAYDLTSSAWLGTYYAIKHKSVWRSPQKITALPAGSPPAVLITTSGSINPGPNGTLLMLLWDAASGKNFYLVTSADGGQTWGGHGGTITLLADRRGSPIGLATGQNEASIYYLAAGRTNYYIVLGRGCANSGVCGGNQLKYAWSTEGTVWNVATTTSPASQNQISPILLRLPNSWAALVWAERPQKPPPFGVLHWLVFDPLTTFGNPTAFAATQDIWAGNFNAWGYPAAALFGASHVALAWDSEIFPGGTRHIYMMNGKFVLPQKLLNGARLHSGTVR